MSVNSKLLDPQQDIVQFFKSSILISSEYNFDEESHSIGNGFSGFSVIGIYFYKEHAIAIPEHTFAIYDASINDRTIASTSGPFDNRPTPVVVFNNRS